MDEDPIVDEVRRVRAAHAAMFNNDLRAIFLDIKRQEQESGRTYVRYPPKRPMILEHRPSQESADDAA
jgi:hypothetical protein